MTGYTRQIISFFTDIPQVGLACLKESWNTVSFVLSIFFAVFPYILLAGVCVCADYLLLEPEIANNIDRRALTDNVAHGVIAIISWLIVVGVQTRKDIIEGIVCGVMALAIDIDHFIAAGSLSLKGALSLRNRPFLHTTTIVPVVAPILQVWIAQNIPPLKLLPFMFTVAILSHHLRDGQRRGLWFWPLGSSPPLPYWLYITCELLLPYVVTQMISVIDSMPDRAKQSLVDEV